MYNLAVLIALATIVSAQAVNISLETDLQELFAGSTIRREIMAQPEGIQETFTAIADNEKEVVATLSPTLGYWVRLSKKRWQRREAEEYFNFLKTEYENRSALYRQPLLSYTQ